MFCLRGLFPACPQLLPARLTDEQNSLIFWHTQARNGKLSFLMWVWVLERSEAGKIRFDRPQVAREPWWHTVEELGTFSTQEKGIQGGWGYEEASNSWVPLIFEDHLCTSKRKVVGKMGTCRMAFFRGIRIVLSGNSMDFKHGFQIFWQCCILASLLFEESGISVVFQDCC